ncbi:14910_t:CDS:2 [Entrophospora sp. SA101]|nr:14910_t:CDS:2 [Entrophospora sp. SA101]
MYFSMANKSLFSVLSKHLHIKKSVLEDEEGIKMITLGKDLAIFGECMGQTELDYLRIKTSVHVRGVLG